MNVVGIGLGPHEDDLVSLGGPLERVVGQEHRLAGGRARHEAVHRPDARRLGQPGLFAGQEAFVLCLLPVGVGEDVAEFGGGIQHQQG